jgi:hypothetical protein
MQTVAQSLNSVNVRAILIAAGYSVHARNRANCPHCSGHSRLTVAFTNDGRFFCHRCGKGGHVRSLAREQGVTFPRPRIRKADMPKAAFRRWLSEKMTALGNEERKAYTKVEWAISALHSYKDFEPAWEFLRWFYERRYVWESFWESGTDRIGRLHLYKVWRRHGFK